MPVGSMTIDTEGTIPTTGGLPAGANEKPHLAATTKSSKPQALFFILVLQA